MLAPGRRQPDRRRTSFRHSENRFKRGTGSGTIQTDTGTVSPGRLLGIYHVSLPDLTQIRGIGPVKAVQLKCIAELSRRMAKAQAGSSLSFTDPETVAEYYMEDFRHEEQEKLMVLLLNNRGGLLEKRSSPRER